MSYYCFNIQELLQKAKKEYDNGGKEKAAKYYQSNKDVIKEKANSKYKNLTKEKKEAKKEYSKNRYKKQNKMQKKILISFYSINMSEKTLKFDNIVVNKKNFMLLSKQLI